MVLKLERFSRLSRWSFGFGSPIRLGYLSLVLSFKASVLPKRATWCPKKGFGVKAIQSESRPRTYNFSRGGQWYHHMVLKFERFFYLSGRSFGLDSSIRLG